MFKHHCQNFMKQDPRHYQLMVLGSMLIYGLVWVKLERDPFWIAGILVVALFSQFAATKYKKLPRFEWKSAMISGLSLSILMKTTSLPVALLLAAVAILSKFVFRWKGKHIFNPTNFALALGLLATNEVAVVPGQWGNGIILAFFIASMGVFVVNKACRGDVSLAFFATYATALISWSLWMDKPLIEPIQRLQTGSLLIFTFYMITDPKSTPDSRLGRFIFGVAVAALGIYLQLAHSIPGGLIISLVFLSLMTPFLDQWFPGEKFQWQNSSPAPSRT